MTVTKNETKFDRIWTITTGFLCLIGLVFTIIALCTPSWTIVEHSSDGEVQWHGLFNRCNRFKCVSNYNQNMLVIFLIIIGTIILLFSTISIFLMGLNQDFRRYFYLISLLTFHSIMLQFIGVGIYSHQSFINGISARIMITSIILTCLILGMMSFITGRYSIFYEKNRGGYQLTQTEGK